MSGVGPNQETPALLTSTSTGPACWSRSSTPAPAGSLRSAAAKRAFPPSAAMASTTAAAPAGVAPVHDDLGAVPGQLPGRGLADAGGRAGDQRAQAFEVSLVSCHGADCSGSGPGRVSDA